MKKRILIWTAVGLGSTIMLLFLVLCVHIYIATKASQKDRDVNMRQLSRIDFKEPIDSAEANKIRTYVGSLDGVDGTYFNMKNGAFVYSYIVGTQTSQGVYDKVMSIGHYKAERYIVDPKDLKGGCPVGMDNDSFSARLSSYLVKLFN